MVVVGVLEVMLVVGGGGGACWWWWCLLVVVLVGGGGGGGGDDGRVVSLYSSLRILRERHRLQNCSTTTSH